MSNFSFTKARPVTVAIPSTRRIDVSVDPKLGFNTVIASWDKKVENNIYSIDPVPVLKHLIDDNVEALVDITLGCQIRRDAAAVWDVVFNALRRDRLVACVFVADENYAAVPKVKVLTHSQFLDQDRYNSRLQENMVDKGNKIGVGIYNEIDQKTYVLLYTITGHCHAQHISEDETRRSKANALNLKLDHVYAIDEDDVAGRLDIDENVTPSEDAHAFVEWLATCVNNTRLAYPWKPNFQPAAPRPFNRQRIEKALKVTIPSAVESTYEDFENLCRNAYNKIRAKRSEAMYKRNASKEESGNKEKKNVEYNAPEIEVVSLGDDRRFFVRIAGDQIGYIIEKPEDIKTNILERFIFNKDLEGRILREVSGVFVTDQVEEGKTYTLRYLTVNF